MSVNSHSSLSLVPSSWKPQPSLCFYVLSCPAHFTHVESQNSGALWLSSLAGHNGLTVHRAAAHLRALVPASNVPACGYAAFCCSVHPPTGTGAASPFWQELKLPLWTCVSKFRMDDILISLGYIPDGRCAGSHGNSLILWRPSETSSKQVYATSHSH